MEKYIVKRSYWLGVVCAVITLVLRGLDAVAVFPNFLPGANSCAMSFYTAALLFLAVAIGAASAMWSRAQKDQKE